MADAGQPQKPSRVDLCTAFTRKKKHKPEKEIIPRDVKKPETGDDGTFIEKNIWDVKNEQTQLADEYVF